MAESFELRDISERPQQAAQPTPAIDSDDADGTITSWSLAAFALLLIFMAGEPRTLLTPLEAFLSFQFGILLLAVSLGVLVNSPPGALYTVSATEDQYRHQFCHPLLTPITGASLLMSLSAYNSSGIGMLSSVFSIITGTVGLWGLWTIIFAGSGRRSKLGADKRTSAFIFGNKSAASEIKKSAKKKRS